MAGPVGKSRGARNEDLVFHIRVFLFDNRVSNLVRSKHESYRDSHDSDHSLRRIDVGL